MGYTCSYSTTHSFVYEPAAIGFCRQKRLQKRLTVRKTERGDRELSFDYRIVAHATREEEIRATHVGVHDERSRYVRVRQPTCCDLGFCRKKRLQKRLKVRKTERGERELSFDYRIVENERQEEEICATYVGVHDERSRDG